MTRALWDRSLVSVVGLQINYSWSSLRLRVLSSWYMYCRVDNLSLARDAFFSHGCVTILEPIPSCPLFRDLRLVKISGHSFDLAVIVVDTVLQGDPRRLQHSQKTLFPMQNQSLRKLHPSVDLLPLRYQFARILHLLEVLYSPFSHWPLQNDISWLDSVQLNYLHYLKRYMSLGGFPSGVKKGRKAKYLCFRMEASSAGAWVKQTRRNLRVR